MDTDRVQAARAFWRGVLRSFPKLRHDAKALEAMERVGVNSHDLELRGGARRHRPRPARDRLHANRRGSHGAEAKKWTQELELMRDIAQRDAEHLDPHELPTEEHLVLPYLELLVAIEPTHNGGFIVCEKVPPFRYVRAPGFTEPRPGTTLSEPMRVAVEMSWNLGPGESRSRSARSTSAAPRQGFADAELESVSFISEYILLPPDHAAAMDDSAADQHLRRLAINLRWERPPKKDDIKTRRRRFRARSTELA